MPTQGRYVPGVVPLELVLARNEQAAIVLRALYAYSDGVSFQLDAFVRSPVDAGPVGFSSGFASGPIVSARSVTETPDGDDERPARPTAAAVQRFMHGGLPTFDDFNFGVQFPDGVKVTTLRPYVPDLDVMHPPTEPPTHGLDMGGGGGSSAHFEYSYFVWPLPGEGTIALVCEWAGHGINETVYELDARVILDAARRVQPLWEEDAGRPSHLGLAASMVHMHKLRPNSEAG
jgi:hypothetical protein